MKTREGDELSGRSSTGEYVALGFHVFFGIIAALIGAVLLYGFFLWPVLFARYRAEEGYGSAYGLLVSGYVFEIFWLAFLAWGTFHLLYRKKRIAMKERSLSQARKHSIIEYLPADQPALVEVLEGIVASDWEDVEWHHTGHLSEYRSAYRGGPKIPKPVKQGLIFLSENALHFEGEGTSRKWLWDRVLDVRTDGEALMIQVSGRQATSGVILPYAAVEELRQVLEVMRSTSPEGAAEARLQLLHPEHGTTGKELADAEYGGLAGGWLHYSRWLDALKRKEARALKFTAAIGLPLIIAAVSAGARVGGDVYASEFYHENTLARFGEFTDYDGAHSNAESPHVDNGFVPEVEALYSDLSAVDLSGKYLGKIEVVLDEATDPQGQGVPSEIDWPTPKREIVISQSCSDSLLGFDTCKFSHGSYSLFRLDEPTGDDASARDYEGASMDWSLDATEIEFDGKGWISSVLLEAGTSAEDECYSVDSGNVVGVVISDIDATLSFAEPEYKNGRIIFRSVELSYSDDAGDPVEGEGCWESQFGVEGVFDRTSS